MKATLYPLLFILSLLSFTTQAHQHHSKLEIKAKEVYKVKAGNRLQVDTLIMHDKAVIQFSSEQESLLSAKHAFIGNECTITAKGADGARASQLKAGTDGADGGDLTVQIHIEALGSLTVDTRGGDGGNGYNGRNGKAPHNKEVYANKPNGKGGFVRTKVMDLKVEGTAGEKGTSPGNGGNGGNISLTYSTSGFIPRFNHEDAPQSIVLLYEAGKAGKNSRDGLSYNGTLKKVGDINTPAPKTLAPGTVKLVNENNNTAAAPHELK